MQNRVGTIQHLVHSSLFHRTGRRFALLVSVLLLIGGWHHRHARPSAPAMITPKSETVFTSTRYITCLLTAPDGDVWAGTLGGILRHTPDGRWQKFTRQDDLPSEETRSLDWRSGTLIATFPTGSASWRNERWQTESQEKENQHPSLLPDQNCAATWQGHRCVSTLAGLTIQDGNHWRALPQPPGGGTHVSALLPQKDTLLAALFGDGLWQWNGRTWQPVNIGLPPDAREITALTGTLQHLWLGTRRAGVWEYAEGHWLSHKRRSEPVDHNCQALCLVGKSLWISTQEDGLAVRTPTGWGHYSAGALASNAPRQMVMFGNALYLRHGNGKIDRFEGGRWERNICRTLPRREVSALAADAHRLYAAQWGGWSEFDGQTWRHYLDLPELQGLPITVLYPQGDTLWIGTQGRGLAEYSHVSHSLRWHDERSGLKDDWITTLACMEGRIVAGTFVGGLAVRNGGQWTSPAALKVENVTALEPDSSGGLFVATRHDVWHLTREAKLCRLQSASPGLYAEAQALCCVPGGLWIGTRTGLVFCPDDTLQRLAGD